MAATEKELLGDSNNEKNRKQHHIFTIPKELPSSITISSTMWALKPDLLGSIGKPLPYPRKYPLYATGRDFTVYSWPGETDEVHESIAGGESFVLMKLFYVITNVQLARSDNPYLFAEPVQNTHINPNHFLVYPFLNWKCQLAASAFLGYLGAHLLPNDFTITKTSVEADGKDIPAELIKPRYYQDTFD